MINVYKRVVKIRNLAPVFTRSQAYSLSSLEEAANSGSSQSGKSGIGSLYNLVHALAAQIIIICNLTKRHAGAALANNFGISRIVASRTRLQWTPLPAWKRIENFLLFSRDHSLLLALAYVANPSPDLNFLTVDDLHMNGRDSAVTGSVGELLECCSVQIESRCVVHG